MLYLWETMAGWHPGHGTLSPSPEFLGVWQATGALPEPGGTDIPQKHPLPSLERNSCTRDLLGISAFTKLTKGFKKWFLNVQSRLSLVLSASRDRRRRTGKPREEDGEQLLPVQLQDRIKCQRQKEGRRGWGRGPAALAPDEQHGSLGPP